jgi:hypothetical protein
VDPDASGRGAEERDVERLALGGSGRSSSVATPSSRSISAANASLASASVGRDSTRIP